MPSNYMIRYNDTTKKWEKSINEGSSWTDVDITGMTMNLTQVDGAALATHGSGYVPGDVREVDGVALPTHSAGEIPADVRHWAGVAPNALIGGRVDANAQVVGDKTGYALTAGSYSIRVAAVQRATVAVTGANATANSAALSAVTMTRVPEQYCGMKCDQTGTVDLFTYLAYIALTSTTLVTITRHQSGGGAATSTAAFVVPEYF